MTGTDDRSVPSSELRTPSSIPEHVSIIMDGNGRWAKSRGLPRIAGHERGAESVRAVMRASRDLGIKYLTLYAFSVENWIRPKDEVSGLMMLLRRFLKKNEFELHDNKVRLHTIGQTSDLPESVREVLLGTIERTAEYDDYHLTLALSYGGRREIANAARQIAEKAVAGEIEPGSVNEDTVAAHLYAPDIPDPDMMIRTSGEMRISNFMLWQLSYSELYITDVLWPDFREKELAAAIEEYGRRQRRFGDIE